MLSMTMSPLARKISVRLLALALPVFMATSCAQVSAPDGRTVNIPTVTPPSEKPKTVHDRRTAVTRVKLGRDVLVPHAVQDDPLPDDVIGPYELRGETLASALQLILDEYDISIAFETDRAMTERITIANLRGRVDNAVDKICALANLYCRYEKGTLVVKETETFIVDLPPLMLSSSDSSTGGGAIGGTGIGARGNNNSGNSNSGEGSYDDIVNGLEAIIGTEPTVDQTTRVMIYTAGQRANKYAERYFERLRKNTALIIYETHIWEVVLNNSNRTGIDWSALFNNVGNFNIDVALPGGAPTAAGAAAPISITPTYTGSADVSSEAVLEFISERGTVKTVSQPQLTVLSGSQASLSVEQSENFVSGLTRTPSTVAGVPDSVSTTTQTVETGLTMSVQSSWDQSTVYGTISILLNELLDIDEFQPDANTTIQLPQTTTRSLSTQIRVRPGDAVLIAGLVSEKDDYSASGPGFLKPLLQTSRSASTRNSELVFMLRPRVIAFEAGTDEDTVEIRDAFAEPKKPSSYQPRDLTKDIGSLFDTASDAAPAALPESVSAHDLSPAQPETLMPVEEEAPAYMPEQAPAAPQQHTDAAAPVALTPQSQLLPVDAAPTVQAPERQLILKTPNTGLPSWLPSQGGSLNNGGKTP